MCIELGRYACRGDECAERRGDVCIEGRAETGEERDIVSE